jgi:hypothetical protein
MEYAMRVYLSSAALGLALAAGASAANAQTVIAQPAATVITPPAQTVQTIETIRTVRPASRAARREVVTTRTITREVVPTTTVVASTPRPLYDVVTPAPLGNPDDTPALYDTAVPVAPAMAAQAVGAAPVIYRYVYEPDRILVIDPTTGIAVQAIPR